MNFKINSKGHPLLALLLLVPAPSLGVLLGMILFPDSSLGCLLFGFTKVWMVVLPVFWLIAVDKKPLGGSPARRGGFVTGILSGLLIAGGIVAINMV